MMYQVCLTLWPQPFRRLMQHELNLKLDDSRDEPDNKQVLLCFKGALHSQNTRS